MPVEPSVARALNAAIAKEVVTALRAVGRRGPRHPDGPQATGRAPDRAGPGPPRGSSTKRVAARGEPRRERLVDGGPVALSDAAAAQSSRAASVSSRAMSLAVPSRGASAGPCTFHDAMQRLAGAPPPLVTRHLTKPVEADAPHAELTGFEDGLRAANRSRQALDRRSSHDSRTLGQSYRAHSHSAAVGQLRRVVRPFDELDDPRSNRRRASFARREQSVDAVASTWRAHRRRTWRQQAIRWRTLRGSTAACCRRPASARTGRRSRSRPAISLRNDSRRRSRRRAVRAQPRAPSESVPATHCQPVSTTRPESVPAPAQTRAGCTPRCSTGSKFRVERMRQRPSPQVARTIGELAPIDRVGRRRSRRCRIARRRPQECRRHDVHIHMAPQCIRRAIQERRR